MKVSWYLVSLGFILRRTGNQSRALPQSSQLPQAAPKATIDALSCVCQLYWTSSSSIRLAVVTHHDPRHSQACVRFSPAVFACCFTQTTSDRGEQAFHSSSSCCAQKTLPLRAVRSDSSCWIPDAVCGRTGAQHPRLMYRST